MNNYLQFGFRKPGAIIQGGDFYKHPQHTVSLVGVNSRVLLLVYCIKLSTGWRGAD